MIVSLWACVARHVQSTQNNNFAISLQYFKENVKDKVVFSLQINYPKITQNNKFAISLQYLKKEVSK